MAVTALLPDARILAAGVALDFAFGDPVYRAHPVRLIGWTLSACESTLRRSGLDGRAGGVLLFIALGAIWTGGTALLVALSHPWIALALHLFLVYSLLALHDLLRHAWMVETAARRNNTEGARQAIARLVGRDTSVMDIAACRRAAIESISENLTDGFVSPLFWYAMAGLPGLVLFKVVSTMDSMVGYKTPRYFYFGWCGARLDDLMNLIPARLTWLLLAGVAAILPGCSFSKALHVGWQQHATLPGPNSGWSEAATAGAIQRKLIGPIYADGALVTEVWIGDPADPPAATASDLTRAGVLVFAVGCLAAGLAIWAAAAQTRPGTSRLTQ